MRTSRATPTAECAHAPIVEALHDGRLGPQEKASIERHLGACAACAAQRQVLVAIREHVRVAPLGRTGDGAAELTPLAHQRARSALLRAAVDLEGASNREATARIAPSRLRARVAPFALAAVFVSIALFVGWSWGRSSTPTVGASASVASTSSTRSMAQSSVDPESGARFERSRIGGADEVKLTTGSLRVRAVAPASGARLVVRVGGAVLQPKEAVFRVTAEDGEIHSVVVEEGSVELEVAGYYAEIPAGGSWRAPIARASSTSVASTASAPPVAIVTPPATTPPVAIVTPPATTPPIVDAPPAPKAPFTTSTPTRAPPKKTNGFSSAMRTLDQGDYDAAAREMDAFSKAHPNDPRADEADYMSAIALERAGRADEARAAAQRYLARWPSGAHRAEASAIAHR